MKINIVPDINNNLNPRPDKLKYVIHKYDELNDKLEDGKGKKFSEEILNTTILEKELYNKDIKVTLTLGVDTPPRNNIKRLEGLNPNIFLVYWQEAPDVLRHATIIESNGSYGIWAGVYSNLVYIDYSI